jgi:hypothetical protein
MRKITTLLVENTRVTIQTTGKGSDATISYNPDKTTGGKDVNNSTERPAEIGLAHELGHARNMANGVSTTASSGVEDPDGSGTILSKEELNVRKVENEIRAEQSLPLRKLEKN